MSNDNGNLPASPIYGADQKLFNLKGFDGGYLAQAELSSGLTKREHFAAMSMQGLMSNSAVKLSGDKMIILAVEAADRLLAALDKGE